MQNSELVNILRHLDQKSIKQLQKYVASPFFNENEQVLALLKYLISFGPHYENQALERKVVFKVFFPNNSYEKNNGIALRQLINGLTRLVESFIEYEENQNTFHKIRTATNSLNFYSVKNLDKSFYKSIKNIQQQHIKIKSDPTHYHYSKFLIQLQQLDFFSTRDLQKSNQALKDSLENLEYYYILSKLQLSCLSICNALMIKSDIDDQQLQIFLQEIKHHQFYHLQTIEIYYYALSFLIDLSQEEQFEIFKDLLEKRIDLFDKAEARQLYVYAKNFCLLKMQEGLSIYNEKMFQLLQQELQQDIIYADGKLLDSYFKEIVLSGIRLKKLDWVATFIENHRDKILSDNPKDVYLFNKALLAFSRGHYEEVLELIKFSKFKDLYYKLSARILLIKVYYETNETRLLDADIHSLKLMVYRDQILSSKRKKQYQNFCKLLDQINNTIPKDQKRVEKLRKKVKTTKELTTREWLVEKLEDLK